MMRRSPDVFFVQIGAMDGISFDPLHKYVVQHKWRGLLVEPLPDMFAELKETYKGVDGLIFENVAIAERSGQRDMYRVRKEAIDRKLVPFWAKGISTFADNDARNVLGLNPEYQIDRDQIRPHIVTETIRCETLVNLFAKHEIERVDVFVTDVEGYDYEIFRQLDLERYGPTLIRLEWLNLSESDRHLTIKALKKFGYKTKCVDVDLLAWKRR